MRDPRFPDGAQVVIHEARSKRLARPVDEKNCPGRAVHRQALNGRWRKTSNGRAAGRDGGTPPIFRILFVAITVTPGGERMRASSNDKAALRYGHRANALRAQIDAQPAESISLVTGRDARLRLAERSESVRGLGCHRSRSNPRR